MKRTRAIFFFVLVLAVTLAPGQRRRRDPLTDAETDELREVAQEGDKRLKLYAKFVRARMVAIEQVRSDPKFAEDRGKRLHDLLEDLGAIVDEMDQNVDTYDKQKADLRKPLKDVVEMDSDLQLKLRAIKESAADPKLAPEAREYKFVLDDAMESVNASAESARETLQAENEEFAKKKEKEAADKQKQKEIEKQKQKNCPIRAC